MLSSPRNSVTHNHQAKLAIDYNELLKELSSHEMTSVGCYTIGETIGEGTFGKVKKGYHKLTGRLVAIKKISKQHAPMMAREIHHHRQLKHPNIVMLYEMITTESAIHIISEYCPNGDLLDALTDSGRCSEIRVHKWFHQLTDAIKYCHTRGIVHRDLKLENILLDADDNVKICDFGFARFTQKNQYLETFCGSLSYSAPEVILRKKYTGPETDIWSLGVILYTLLAGEYPFDDDSEVMTQRKIVGADYEIPFYFSTELSNLIQQMLQLEPSERITIDNIVEHPWMIIEEVENNTTYNSSDDDISCLTPSSSTTTNQSDNDSIFSQHQENTIAAFDDISSPDLKFSPQVRSSLGMLRPSSQQQQLNKSPRFSAPSLNRRANNFSSNSNSFRTSLPSSFYQSRDSGVFADNSINNMSPIEQKLFAALTTAGFDKDALIKMQTGECDTSSTLWHLLLENMSTANFAQQQKTLSSVPDAFLSAMQSRNHKSLAVEKSSSPDLYHINNKQHVNVGIQTSFDEDIIEDTPVVNTPVGETIQTTTTTVEPSLSSPPPLVSLSTVPEYVKPYPRPPMNRPQNTIHTVGFGSTTNTGNMNEKSGWFSSVKSWFGSKQQQQQQQQQLQMMQQQNELILQHQQQKHRGRSSSNCSTMSSPIASPSSYRNFDIEATRPEAMVMSPPVYRTGSQKYRRRVLQLSDPPISELDQLTYNGTSTTSHIHHNNKHSSITNTTREYNSNTTNTTNTNTNTNNYHNQQQQQLNIHQVNMPPTALTSTRLVTDSFSILNDSSEPREIDICEKRYSMYRPQQPSTPPPSPPTLVADSRRTSNVSNKDEVSTSDQVVLNNLLCSPISPIEERTLSSLENTNSDNETTVEKVVDHSLSDFSSDSSDDCSSIGDCEEQPVDLTHVAQQQEELPVSQPSLSSMFNNNRPRSGRFEFAPRSRLSVFGMQEPRGSPMGSKVIIEEEEEEE